MTDRHHHPLAGATVQLEDEFTQAVTTYLADADGHFLFKRLCVDDDYRISATFKGHRSKGREVSHFSNKTNVSLRLVVRGQ